MLKLQQQQPPPSANVCNLMKKAFHSRKIEEKKNILMFVFDVTNASVCMHACVWIRVVNYDDTNNNQEVEWEEEKKNVIEVWMALGGIVIQSLFRRWLVWLPSWVHWIVCAHLQVMNQRWNRQGEWERKEMIQHSCTHITLIYLYLSS